MVVFGLNGPPAAGNVAPDAQPQQGYLGQHPQPWPRPPISSGGSDTSSSWSWMYGDPRGGGAAGTQGYQWGGAAAQMSPGSASVVLPTTGNLPLTASKIVTPSE